MTSEEFRDAIAALGLTQGQAARFLDLSIRTVNNYANAREDIPQPVSMLLRLLVNTGLTATTATDAFKTVYSDAT